MAPAISAMRPAFCGGMTLATAALTLSKSVADRVGRGIDRGDLAAHRQRDPFEVRIHLLPGVLEQALLGEGILGVEDHHLGARLLRLEIPGDEARALIRAGRATIRILRRHDHHDAAVLHRLDLAAQQHGLLAGLPGMRHALGGGLVVARQRVEAQLDAGGEDQPVVIEGAAVGERHRARGGVDAGRAGLRERDAVAGDLAVAELLLLDVAQAGDDVVAERTGGVGRVRLDHRDVEPLVVALRHARRGESGEAATDHDDLRRRALREHRARQHRRGDAGADASGEVTAARMKSCHARLRLFLRPVPGGDRLDLPRA